MREEYEAGHVPGAVFLDWTRDIVDPDDPVPSQIAKPDAFASKMSQLGIGDDMLVVAYDDYRHIFAGRLAWALRYYGHDAVCILDGGWSRWRDEGRPISRESAPTDGPRTGGAPPRFTPRARPALRKSADEVARALGRSDVLLIDARPTEQYIGTSSAARRAGHIPGARNVPYPSVLDAQTGRFLPAHELERAFSNAGIDVTRLPKEVVVYCNGGVSCTTVLHALRLLGRTDIAVYDGSWNEWGNDDQRPAKRGNEP
jgi:thiosulfate/3-mercaptopyruvate sulfurtransferase